MHNHIVDTQICFRENISQNISIVQILTNVSSKNQKEWENLDSKVHVLVKHCMHFTSEHKS